MRRLSIALAMLGLIACGGQDSRPGTEPRSEETPTVSAGAPEAAELEAAEASGEASAAADERVTSCLELAQAGQFAEALPVCTEAIGIDPENADVQAALERAQAELAEASAEEIPGTND